MHITFYFVSLVMTSIKDTNTHSTQNFCINTRVWRSAEVKPGIFPQKLFLIPLFVLEAQPLTNCPSAD